MTNTFSSNSVATKEMKKRKNESEKPFEVIRQGSLSSLPILKFFEMSVGQVNNLGNTM